MPVSLTDQNIDATYYGLIHAQGTSLPSTGQVVLYDGSGVVSSLAIGTSAQGVTVTGQLASDTLDTGSATIDSLTITTSAGATAINTVKAWVLFSGNDGTIRSQYNVASVVKPGGATGEYTITFTTPMADANYVVHATPMFNNTGPYISSISVKSTPAPSTTSFTLKSLYLNGTTPTAVDFTTIGVTVYHA